MSNLGDYQRLTTVAKKVGGPKILVASLMGIGVISEIVISNGARYVKNKLKNNNNKFTEIHSIVLYRIIKDVEIDDAIKLKKGDLYRILENDGDVELIEIIGDKNNPYILSKTLLKEVSEMITKQ